jgi:spore germination protein GerM
MKRIFCFFLLLTLSLAASAQNINTTVYLGNSDKDPQSEDCSKVYPSTRSIVKTTMVANAALNELFKGPTEKEAGKKYTSLFSKTSADILISLKIKKGTAYVNLKSTASQALNAASTSCGRDMFFAQVEKTLLQFPSVTKVFFAIEGKPEDFYDWMELECPQELGKCNGKEFR